MGEEDTPPLGNYVSFWQKPNSICISHHLVHFQLHKNPSHHYPSTNQIDMQVFQLELTRNKIKLHLNLIQEKKSSLPPKWTRKQTNNAIHLACLAYAHLVPKRSLYIKIFWLICLRKIIWILLFFGDFFVLRIEVLMGFPFGKTLFVSFVGEVMMM